ncbi:MAG TPA: GNAT family N-acetyltransferase, partial [Candidatus Saccharimonadales bacterium]|nr:GNAT family N-acetyltransferase [Candidatus Saccharimonadales bacterium]
TEPTEPTPDLRVANNPDARRYEAWLGDQLAGFAEYEPAEGRVIFTHTEIDPGFSGRGGGTGLARAALDDVRARGLRVTPLCPFIAAWIKRHPIYADLVVGIQGRSARG